MAHFNCLETCKYIFFTYLYFQFIHLNLFKFLLLFHKLLKAIILPKNSSNNISWYLKDSRLFHSWLYILFLWMLSWIMQVYCYFSLLFINLKIYEKIFQFLNLQFYLFNWNHIIYHTLRIHQYNFYQNDLGLYFRKSYQSYILCHNSNFPSKPSSLFLCLL